MNFFTVSVTIYNGGAGVAPLTMVTPDATATWILYSEMNIFTGSVTIGDGGAGVAQLTAVTLDTAAYQWQKEL